MALAKRFLPTLCTSMLMPCAYVYLHLHAPSPPPTHTHQALALRSSERYGSLVDWRGRLDPVTVRSIFDEFDTDHSGAIDKGEVQVRGWARGSACRCWLNPGISNR